MARKLSGVSVVVLNYNGTKMLRDCLSSLVDQRCGLTEIIVVDNCSTDGSEKVVGEFPEARWLQMGSNSGYAPANNRAARVARGEFIWFVNNDMRFAPDCVEQLQVPLQADPAVFAADSKILAWNGAGIGHGGPVLRRRPFWLGSSFIIGVNIDYVGLPCLGIDVPWGCGGALMVRRSMFEALGGFDRTFVFDFEDVDLCWRAWRRSWRSIYVPNAKVYHHVSASFKADEYQNTRRGYSGYQNHQRFVWKTMDWHAILADILSNAARSMVKACIPSRRREARAWFRATSRNLSGIRSILRERQAVAASSRYSNRFLVARFLAIGRRERTTVWSAD